MNEDYLWDKSGEADPEIERIERALGRLRYKAPSKPFTLPVASRSWFRPRFSPALAIAAAIVILLVAGGLWVSFRRSEATHIPQIVSGSPPRTGPIDPIARDSATNANREPIEQVTAPGRRAITPRLQGRRQQQLARDNQISRSRYRRDQQIARRGELAKEQLIKALLITSDKLNAMQKKLQGSQEREPIS